MLNAVIIGAGPYGLSVAANLRSRGISFRIFGRLMDSWLAHMPKGMMLKSDGFASNIDDPDRAFTLRQYCAEQRVEYGDTGIPVRLETFTGYGVAFRDRMVPELEEKFVVSVDRASTGFTVKLDDGETVETERVVLAIGITHFEYVPDNLAHLPSQFLSHSADHRELTTFRGRSVVVIGGGSSALDLAGLLQESGADVQLVARQEQLKFHGKPTGKPRTLWERVRNPRSGLGPGWRSRFFSDAPGLFHYLPENLRVGIVRRALGPSGGWFIKDKVIGKLPVHLGNIVLGAEVQDGKVRLRLRAGEGPESELVVDHIIAATGYKVNLERMTFLSPSLRSKLKLVKGSPALSTTFESSVPGLYFVGLAAANSFGPVMRFAFGAAFAARTIARALSAVCSRSPRPVAVRAAVTSSK